MEFLVPAHVAGVVAIDARGTPATPSGVENFTIPATALEDSAQLLMQRVASDPRFLQHGSVSSDAALNVCCYNYVFDARRRSRQNSGT